jgi:hypothetical protein
VPSPWLSSASLQTAFFAGAAAVVFVLQPGCSSSSGSSFGPKPSGPQQPDQITRPSKLTSVETPTRDVNGKPVRVACATCHALRPPGPLPTSPTELRTFHQGLAFQHGNLVCGSCHLAGRVDVVHLAQGTEIPMLEAMQLCQQCHGPQARDYRHGAHGGMTGRWDRTKGARVRNNCVECHDPHAPHYLGGQPVLEPIDRGLVHNAKETP